MPQSRGQTNGALTGNTAFRLLLVTPLHPLVEIPVDEADPAPAGRNLRPTAAGRCH
jgi:hypothetical protein